MLRSYPGGVYTKIRRVSPVVFDRYHSVRTVPCGTSLTARKSESGPGTSSPLTSFRAAMKARQERLGRYFPVVLFAFDHVISGLPQFHQQLDFLCLIGLYAEGSA